MLKEACLGPRCCIRCGGVHLNIFEQFSLQEAANDRSFV